MSNKTSYSQVEIGSLAERAADRSLEAVQIAKRVESKLDSVINQVRPWWVNVSYPVAALSLLGLLLYCIVTR